MFDLDDDPIQNNVAWFLIGDFLRLSPWSRGLGQEAQAVPLRKFFSLFCSLL